MKTCVGLLQQEKEWGVVILDRPDPLLGREVHVAKNQLQGAPYGMKVVCELLQDITEPVDQPAQAKVVEVLGDPGRPDVAMRSIIRHHGLPEAFPRPVMTAASRQPLQLDEETIDAQIKRGRKDLRSLRIMTIDGAEAKDLDDGISIEPLPQGGHRLGVHIADVTHYVREDQSLDKEARKRGTSVYLVDRVIPMLPPRLSNGICSLNPDQDRLALSVFLDIGPGGETRDGSLCESVIRSQARATYEEVREALENDELPEGRKDEFLADLREMKTLADRLGKNRKRRGSIDFDFPETHVRLDEEGNPVDIYPYPISFANNIIEEFMIAANEFVADLAVKNKLPFLFRVHELPDPEKLERFTKLARALGVKARFKGAPTPGKLAEILATVQSESFGQTLSQLLLRALAKARYDPENLGHFGLASGHYCHFTSPIRRYPDLFVHRVLKAYLHQKVRRDRWRGLVRGLSEHVSETERTAMYAERDTVDQKAAEYMSQHLGDSFDGIISGFNQAGIYVQLQNTVEGMVPFRTMNGYLSYDEERLRVVNETHDQVYNIGDAVTVQVAQADTIHRRIDFEMLSHLNRSLSKPEDRPRHKSGKKKKASSGKTRQGKRKGGKRKGKKKKR